MCFGGKAIRLLPPRCDDNQVSAAMAKPLTAERWRLIDEVLDVILSSEPHRWSSLAGDLCHGDDELRADVDSLLRHAADAPGFLESRPSIAAAVKRLM